MEDLEKMNGKHLLGTRFVKSYMHGYIITSKMFDKLKSESNIFSYEQYKKDKLKEKLDEELKNRIYVKSNKVQVNEGVVMRIRDDENKFSRNRKALKDQQAKET